MNKKYNFCIVTYETLPNPVTQNLKMYLLENYDINLLYIFHPMLDMNVAYQLSSGYHIFENNRLATTRSAYHWQLYLPMSYIKDVIYTFFWCIKFKRKIDIYFAAGNLNPVVGLLLKNFGLVKKVIYLTIDYYPQRFNNKFLNWFYFQLDKFCVWHSDETWNLTPVMAKAREKKMGMKRSIYNKQYTVPNGIWFYKTTRLPFTKINRKKIVYRGTLQAFMGIDLAINAMPLLLMKIPDLKFEIVGTGEDKERLINLAKRLKVSKNVLFHGFVKGRKEMEKVISNGAIGIATFNTDILDEKVKNSDPGKIRDYMLLGMPVITTNAVSYSKTISDNECGIVISYDVHQFASAVLKLLRNKNLLKKYRQNATRYIEQFDCNTIYKPNVERILLG